MVSKKKNGRSIKVRRVDSSKVNKSNKEQVGARKTDETSGEKEVTEHYYESDKDWFDNWGKNSPDRIRRGEKASVLNEAVEKIKNVVEKMNKSNSYCQPVNDGESLEPNKALKNGRSIKHIKQLQNDANSNSVKKEKTPEDKVQEAEALVAEKTKEYLKVKRELKLYKKILNNMNKELIDSCKTTSMKSSIEELKDNLDKAFEGRIY